MFRILLLLSAIPLVHDSFAQQYHKSSKYGYSFMVPTGWRIKEQIALPDTDSKVVDDRGNSLIVSINPLPEKSRQVIVTKILSAATDQELIDMWAATYGRSYILRRGVTIISGKEFYFVHMSCPFKDGLRLVHKMYMYNWKGKSISIDCASISSMEDETSVYFDLMIRTFKLN